MMSVLLNAFREFSQAAAPVVMTALWQGAILACGLAVCLRLAPRISAAHRFGIWAAGFAVVVGLPFLPLLIAGLGGASAVGTFSPGSGPGAAGPLLRLDLRWSLVIGALWISASIARVVGLGVHSLLLRKLWKTARPVPAFNQQCGCPWPLALADQGKRNLNMGRPVVEICTTTELDRPSVIGFFAPRILIPEWLYARLTPEELEHVVLHESEHLRRHDDWTNLLQKLCLVVFPLNPALAWMERRLCREREMACDDGVVRATQAPRAYAACLATLAERGLQRRGELVSGALSLGAWQRRPELVERVHRILKRTPGLSPIAATALVAALGCGLLTGSVEFARCPQLVAFVPTARLMTRQNAAAELGDARYTATSFVMNGRRGYGAGFRAVDAVAHIPAGSARPASETRRIAASASNAASLPEPGSSRGSLVSSQRRFAQHDNHLARVDSLNTERPAQQWIVFTAWEQVESADSATQDSKFDAGVRQDYDASPAAKQATDEGSAPAGSNQTGPAMNQAAQTMRVTHLILRIYTTGSDSTSTTGQSSKANQAALLSLRDGWFVFQL